MVEIYHVEVYTYIMDLRIFVVPIFGPCLEGIGGEGAIGVPALKPAAAPASLAGR